MRVNGLNRAATAAACGLAVACMLVVQGAWTASAKQSAGKLGIFTNQTDVGSVVPAGTASFDAATGVYMIASAGANLWSTTDGFHFVWTKMEGDVSLTADVKLAENAKGSPHRKALLMFRETLDPDAMYADAAVHGNGEIALQYRRVKGDTTQDIAFDEGAPQRMRLEKRGDIITLFVSMHGEPLHQHGASIKMHFEGPFYAGLGVCAHNPEAVEKATFSHVELKPLTPETAGKKALYSTLQTIAIDNNARMAMVVRSVKGQMEAPNWSRDGKTLLFNSGGKMWRIAVEGGEPASIEIGDAADCTGSHGLSPDGKLLAITCTTPEHPGRRVYLLPATGGTPKMLTQNPNSYFHSWSPDGKTILFTRPNRTGGNIYSIAVAGGAETALTTGAGISDDPDYSADGKYIYFNSDRAGGMQIFRMDPDGSHPQQVTFDEKRNWTPHPSPDGKSILILSYDKGVTGHPANKDVTLRILDSETGKIRDLVEIVGGAGSDNVPNWAPDGAHFAFVSFQMLPDPENGSTE